VRNGVARDDSARPIALFLPSLVGGGAERSMLNLAKAFAARGHRVELVLCRALGALLSEVPASIPVVTLKRSRLTARLAPLVADVAGFASLLRPVLLARNPATLRYLVGLARYLKRRQPRALICALTYANLAGLWAREIARARTRVVISEHIHLSRDLQDNRNANNWKWRFVAPLLHRAYPRADAIVAVSNGVADDLSRFADLPRSRVVTIYNPMVNDELLEKAKAPVDHPWFAPGAPPVILGAGRLETQKDFPTLLKAFARVCAQREARLIILGEGREEERLRALAGELGVASQVDLPGFTLNPYAYMARAAVFVLSSAWEGLPLVPVEAMACGCPVVSTDCPSGPAEILHGGVYGPLVPVGDHEAMANAIASMLDQPPDLERLRARAAEFSVERAAKLYLGLIFEAESGVQGFDYEDGITDHRTQP
jgi:glycosyltransferase involved in cell wall biosynthesis